MLAGTWRVRLARSLPFYYGWVVFAVSTISSYSSRPLMAVATLSVFLVPMTDELGWSRGTFAGAVSLGGVCAVVISPLVGWWIDRHGAGAVIAAGGVITGACAVGLSAVTQSWAFYSLYVPGRMAFASPLELGPSTAISNWFVRRRSFAFGVLSVTHGTGLAAMPLIAILIITEWSWPTAWLTLGIYTLSTSVFPPLFLVGRRPEDMGLRADPGPDEQQELEVPTPESDRPIATPEPSFTLGQALNTRAFWLLAAFSACGFIVQAGVSLHQAPHYLDQGLSAAEAAGTVSAFAFSQVPGGLIWASLARRVPVRFLLAMSGVCIGLGALSTLYSDTLVTGIASATLLGGGVGGLHLLLRLAWADYYGRTHLGSIRGVTLPVQIAGQAIGPILAGFVYDARESYQIPFMIFAASGVLGALLVINATPPGRPPASGSAGAPSLDVGD